MARIKKQAKHYVDNKELFKEVCKYVDTCKQAKLEGKEKPKMNNYLGSCVMKIAMRLSDKPNFSGYTYKEDMIADGIENVVKYLDRFDYNKSSNPFAYITQIIFNSFIRRIKIEHVHSDLKQKIIENIDSFENFEVQDGDDRDYHNEFAQNIQSYGIQASEYKQRPIKISKKKK